jgi:hypothetical protein
MITATAPPGLRAELAAVEHDNPGWHCWKSDTGVMHATTCTCPLGGSGTTVEARNPGELRRVIAAQVHEWEVLGLAA